jgi:hypothetical protein
MPKPSWACLDYMLSLLSLSINFIFCHEFGLPKVILWEKKEKKKHMVGMRCVR